MSAKLTCRKCESNSTNLIQVLLWGNRTTYRAAETCDADVQQSSRRGREERGWKEEQPTALPAEGSTRKTEKGEKTTRDISRISLDLEERIGSTRDQMNPELSPERKGSGPTKGPRNELRIEQRNTRCKSRSSWHLQCSLRAVLMQNCVTNPGTVENSGSRNVLSANQPCTAYICATQLWLFPLVRTLSIDRFGLEKKKKRVLWICAASRSYPSNSVVRAGGRNKISTAGRGGESACPAGGGGKATSDARATSVSSRLVTLLPETW